MTPIEFTIAGIARGHSPLAEACAEAILEDQTLVPSEDSVFTNTRLNGSVAQIAMPLVVMTAQLSDFGF